MKLGRKLRMGGEATLWGIGERAGSEAWGEAC